MTWDPIVGNRQLLARSLESVRDPNAQFNARGAVPPGDAINNPNSKLNSSRTRQIEFQKAVRNGLIDINQAYMLVQFIKRAHGEPVFTDAHIEAHLESKSRSPNRGLGSPQSRRRQM